MRNELSGCTKCGEFLYWLKTVQLLKKDTLVTTAVSFVTSVCLSVCLPIHSFTRNIAFHHIAHTQFY
jgi:hypothetical protein